MNRQLMRTFLAAELPGSVCSYLEAVQSRLGRTVAGVRWVRPSSIHLTLKFFGDIASGAIDAISDRVRGRAVTRNPMVFSPAGLGVFPDRNRPRVIWIGLQGDIASLVELQAQLETDFEILGYPKERRFFTPHLTLGRVKHPPDAAAGLRRVLMNGNGPPDAPSFTVTGLTLFKSELQPGGAVYARMGHFPFREGEPAGPGRLSQGNGA